MTQESSKTILSDWYERTEYSPCDGCFYYSPEAKNNCTNKRQKECVENNFKYFTKNL